MSNIIKRENGNRPVIFGSVVDQIFQKNLNRFLDDEFWGFSGITKSPAAGVVPVNIRETDKSYEMELAAPGLQKQDFKLDLNGDTLTISADALQDGSTDGKNDGWVRREFNKTNFSRSFTLDETVDAGKIAARYENGILYLSISKKEYAQKISRAIEVH